MNGATATCTCLDSDEDRAPVRVECGGATGARRPRLVRSHNHGGRQARTLDRYPPRRCEGLGRPKTYCWSARAPTQMSRGATRRSLYRVRSSANRSGACSIPAHARCRNGRVAAAPELAATRRPLREAKRQQLIEECDVRPRDCVPMHGRVRAWSRSTAQQTATTAVGLQLGSDDGLDGTIGFDG